MPLYEYECTSCHRRTEKIQKFSDPDLTLCPFCGGVLERTLTAPNVQFKGGGWYKDLYSSAKPAANGGDSTAATSDSASTDTGSKASESASGSGDSAKPAAAPSPSPAPAPAAPTKA
jgi:putative FmdB family regulatory protein